MITKYSFSNFKAFQKLEDLELSPLTILVGKNSCGKSSILHSFLLLKQSFDNLNQAKSLTIDGKYLKYSNLNEMIFGQPEDEDSEISFLFETETPKNEKKIRLSYKSKQSSENNEIFLSNYQIQVNDKKLDLLNITKKDIKKNSKKINNLAEIFSKREVKLEQNKFLPDNFLVDMGLRSEINSKYKLKPMPVPISLFFEDFLPAQGELKSLLEDLKFISPIRASPNRAYLHYTDDPDDLLYDGSNSAHMLWTKRSEQVQLDKKSYPLIDGVNECIKILGLSQQITPERIGNMLYQLNLNEKSKNKNVSITDVGFGYSQILPVILISLLNNNDNLILVEQPEIHLHPSSSANLADLFLAFINDDKRFLIETHSQEFINRLRLRVIENPELKAKINVVFVHNDGEEGAKIKQFKIDENGMFPEWPDGFIDESDKLAEAILKARISKSRKNG